MFFLLKSKGKRPAKKRPKVSREKRRQYRQNAGSNYKATWIGPDTAKVYPTGWKDGKTNFYRKKMSCSEKRGNVTPPHFWDVEFPDDYVIPLLEPKKSPPPGSYAARRRARFRTRFIKISETKTSQ